MTDYFDKTKLSIRKIPKSLAKNMIIKYHYSAQWTKCSVALGLYRLTGEEHPFFDEPEEEMIGTICYLSLIHISEPTRLLSIAVGRVGL